jgi:hypothetical protein
LDQRVRVSDQNAVKGTINLPQVFCASASKGVQTHRVQWLALIKQMILLRSTSNSSRCKELVWRPKGEVVASKQQGEEEAAEPVAYLT